MPDFIEDYLRYTSGTMPCKEYHIWSMLSVLSNFAGRRFWFPFGHLNFYPHLYVVLVGDPAQGKSTAMNMAKEIVRASGITPLAATQITKEALMEKMSSTTDGKPKKVPFIGQRFFEHAGRKIEYNQYSIYSTELIEFIAPNPQGFLDWLTNAWDEPILDVETKNKGKDFVVGPYVTLLACMTPHKLSGLLKLSILTGGFARRTAFIFSSKHNIVPWPKQPDPELLQRCVEFGQKLQHRSGPFSITPECSEFYVEWLNENERTIKDKSIAVSGWYLSKGEMLFKLSMLIALACDPTGPLVIELAHYKQALRFCALLEENLHRVFEGTGINPNASAINQVIHMLEAMDRPMNRKALEIMFMDNVTSLHELRDTLDQLIQVQRLEQRDIFIDGTLKGSVIATPGTIARYSAVELAGFLVKPVVPLVEIPKDLSEDVGQVPALASPSPDEDVVEDPKAAAPSTAPPDAQHTLVLLLESPIDPPLVTWSDADRKGLSEQQSEK